MGQFWNCGFGGFPSRFRRHRTRSSTPCSAVVRAVRMVLFYNERGKGDHKHIREVETHYVFTTPETLIADFLAAVRTFEEEETDHG